MSIKSKSKSKNNGITNVIIIIIMVFIVIFIFMYFIGKNEMYCDNKSSSFGDDGIPNWNLFSDYNLKVKHFY